MLTPLDECVGHAVASSGEVFDRLAAGLDARGLAQTLRGMGRGLTVAYDVPQAQPGSVYRLRLNLGELSELSRCGASLSIEYGGLSLKGPVDFLAAAAGLCEGQDPTVALCVNVQAQAKVGSGEMDAPAGLRFVGVLVSVGRVVSGAIDPPPYASSGHMEMSIPLCWAADAGPSAAHIRAFWSAGGGPWEYWPGTVDGRARLHVTLPLQDGILALATPPAAPLGAPAPDVVAFVDGTPIRLDVALRIFAGRVLVPVRPLAEALGARVDWDSAVGRVAITRDGQTVALDVGANVGVVNGRRVQLDVPAFIWDGRVLVPLRFIGEALGACVTWDAGARTVRVAKS